MRKEYDDEDEIPERRHSSGKKKKKFGWVNGRSSQGAQSKTIRSSRDDAKYKERTKEKNEKNKQESHEANSDPHARLCHGVYRHGHRQLGGWIRLGQMKPFLC